MFAPEGHIAFKDAAEHLKKLFAYHDPEDLILDLWSMIEGLPIKAATFAGNLLEPGLADLKENVSRPRGVYSLTDNGLIDVWDGRIIAGDFKGCMIVIPKKAWSNYLKGREGQPVSKGGRPKHPAYEWYKARGFDRGAKYLSTLQREMPKDEKGNPPSQATIRAWEKEGQRKPPTET